MAAKSSRGIGTLKTVNVGDRGETINNIGGPAGPPAENGPAADHPFPFGPMLLHSAMAIVIVASWNCHFFATWNWGTIARCPLAISAVHSSDYPEVAVDNRDHTCSGDSAAYS